MAVGLFLLVSCHAMRPVHPAQVGESRTWDRVWVTRPDHSTLVLSAPEVRGDTLSGFVNGVYQEMPLSEAVSISARQRAPARTAAVAIGAAAATYALLAYLGNRSYVGSAQTCSTGLTTDDVKDILPIACCKVQPNTPC
jgi:hypothetical protein